MALRHRQECHPASPSLSWSHSPPLLASHKLATPRRNSPPLVLFSGERPAVGTAFPGHLDAHASRLEPRSHQTDSAWPPSPCATPPEHLIRLPPHRPPWRNKFRRQFASISCQTYPWTFSCAHPPLFGLYKAPPDFNSSVHHPPSYILSGELLFTVDPPLQHHSNHLDTSVSFAVTLRSQPATSCRPPLTGASSPPFNPRRWFLLPSTSPL